jgi:LuxR family maltose regulon positive regulatory protein
MGALFYEWNDLEVAKRHLKQGVEQSKLWGNADTLASGYVTLAKVLEAQADLEGARDALQEAEQTVQRHTVTPPTAARVAASWPRLWLASKRENLAAATHWAKERGLSADEPVGLLREFEHITLARVLMAQGKQGLQEALASALGLLVRLGDAAQAAGRTRSVIEILALQALALQAQGEAAQALQVLERALSLAEPEGYVRTFVDEGPAMAELLRNAASCGTATEYVSKLLTAFGQQTPDKRQMTKTSLPASVFDPQSEAARDSSLIEPLSERELEVLRLIAAGLSNQGIAEELVIALGTVKAHTSNIYGKLGVRSRTQAIARAKELKLL